MSSELAAQIELIRNDMARLESILPVWAIQKALSGADGGADGAALASYREIRVFQHTRGWLFKALRRVLMPFRLMSRGLFTRRAGLSVPALLYSLFLGGLWAGLLTNEMLYRLVCLLTWVAVLLAALAPRLAAYYYLRKNRDIYRYVRKLEEASIYGME